MKKAIILLAAIALAGCSGRERYTTYPDLVPEARIIERTPFSNSTQITVYGDLMPYGSLDYVIVMTRKEDDILWANSKKSVITPGHPDFSMFQERYNTMEETK